MPNELGEGERSVETTDGTRIFYRTVGHGPRMPLLFLHGWGVLGLAPSGIRSCARSTRATSEWCCPTLVDTGDRITPEGFTTERFCGRSVSRSQYDVRGVGAGRGGVQHERALGAVDGLFTAGPCARSDTGCAGASGGSPPHRGDARRLDRRDRARATHSPALSASLRKRCRPAEIVDECFASLQASPEHALRESFRMCCHPGFTDRLGATRAATLVVGGLHDPMLAPDFLRHEVVQTIPGARLALVDSGHEIPIELPGELAAR